jgi:hypothetical protein
LITDTLTVPSRHGIASEKEIFAQLRAAGWEEIPSNKWNAYGEINRIVFSGSAEEPGVLVVSTQLWLPCGSADPDTAIYVFHGSVRDWKLVLSTDADFMPSGDNGVGMQYRISPPDAKGGWYLAIAQTPPACGPVPADLRYKILRPGPSAAEPRILMNHREPLNTKFSPPFRLETEDDWFAVTRGKQRKLDGEPGVSITRYQITGDQIVRIQPLALTPDDFLDEWVQLGWSEASRWSGSQTDLSTWHSKLQALDSDSTEFEFVQPCPQEPRADKQWLAGLWIDQKLNPASAEKRVFIVLREQNHSFFVDSIGTTRPAGCPGKARRIGVSLELPEW